MESGIEATWNRFWNRGNGNRGPMEAEVESGIEASWKPKRNRGSGIEATWKPKWNRGSGSQLLLGIGVPFLTWFRNRLSDPGPVLRNSAVYPFAMGYVYECFRIQTHTHKSAEFLNTIMTLVQTRSRHTPPKLH